MTCALQQDTDSGKEEERENPNLEEGTEMAAVTGPNSEGSEIAEFYDSRCVLITGATGFMGKVLVEKLLRSCPGIQTIFLLMRAKSGADVRTRLHDLVSAKVSGSWMHMYP